MEAHTHHEIRHELEKQREEHISLKKDVRTLGEWLRAVESILRECGCPNSEPEDDGEDDCVWEDCGECAWCKAFQDD